MMKEDHIFTYIHIYSRTGERVVELEEPYKQAKGAKQGWQEAKGRGVHDPRGEGYRDGKPVCQMCLLLQHKSPLPV